MAAANGKPILISGGGIGGLITAFALARNGLAVRVFEQADEFREVGAGIQLRGTGTGGGISCFQLGSVWT